MSTSEKESIRVTGLRGVHEDGLRFTSPLGHDQLEMIPAPADRLGRPMLVDVHRFEPQEVIIKKSLTPEELDSWVRSTWSKLGSEPLNGEIEILYIDSDESSQLSLHSEAPV